jgi:hypothetical protein
MTHIETIRALTKAADEARDQASRSTSDAAKMLVLSGQYRAEAAKFEARAAQYEDSIDALQAIATSEATA